ncbi:Solute-binding protein family 3/N-terminal domain of MltF [Sesbania bispinosa]|nr:Solute-binding protein family 3/N-terminal domain of MltF [Sesbania bispinosa]
MAQTVPVKVGIVVDVGGIYGKMGLSCINMAISDFYQTHSHYHTRLLFNVRDSQGDVVTAAAQALDLIKNEEVEAIIGPITSMEANFVIKLGEKTHVPIITFSATSPSLTSLRSQYSFRISQNDSSQVNAITSIIQAFGWKAIVPIYIDNDYGKGIIPFLTTSLQQVYIRIPYLSAISSSATDDDIREELYMLMTMQTRVFIVHMSPNLASRLLTIAKEIGMMNEGYVWIVTDSMANVLSSSLDSQLIKESMQGVLGVKTYIPRTEKFDDFKARWRRKFLQEYPTLVDTKLDAFGVWAYDATIALAMAVEKVGGTNFKGSRNMSGLGSLGVSQSGEKLSEILSSTRFIGLSGEISLIDGQLQASTFEIINVNGNGERRVGFWTSQNGLVRDLNVANTNTTYSVSKNNLGPIIWPGDTYSIPKGWEDPTNAKKLKIGVPVRKGFTEFVKVTWNPNTNTSEVTGFSIDVFKAALELLPYALPYEFIPFAKANGESAGSYNELVSQVYFGNFDAVVGDPTITANRSKYVDFTMPYTESGVTMIVPLKANKPGNAWAFLKPLTWNLWAATAFSFIFVSFVVWVLEHRINEDFRGPPLHQIGTSLWFSFSVVVFAHREKVVSNLARFVVIVWVFVVLILVQSYTASLTSFLTVQKLSPTLTNVNQLMKNGLNVGYPEGSFVYGMLKNMGFQDFQLKPYISTEECDDLFTKGSGNGGIAAAFDETPYLKLILETYCSKYIMVGPTFKTDGFGYVFPRGSPLVADISRAILNVTQGDRMKTIENAWFRKSNCPDTNSSNSADNLGLNSFWGLFLIAGSNSNTSMSKRIGSMLSIFDQKDPSSHAFRKKMMQGESENSSTHHHGLGGQVVESSTSTHCPPSPSPSGQSQTESNFSFYGDHGMFSPEYHGDVNLYGHEPHDMEITIVQNVPSTTLELEASPAQN